MPTATLAEPLTADEGLPAHCYRLTAPNAEITPKVARDMVVSLLTATDHGLLVETARLLVSEVVTNVFRHAAATLLTIEATVTGTSLLVRVTDKDPRHAPPEQRSFPDAAAEHGRGIALVNALAARWGVSVNGGMEAVCKTVWFVLEDTAA
jgi:anti-sigma regulatory factor (Ser/Thr protein kinase)